MRIDVLALNNVFDLGLSSVLDTVQTANELIAVSGISVLDSRCALWAFDGL